MKPQHNHMFLLLGVMLAAGCAQTSPRFDQSFGSSVRGAVASQIADPTAAANRNPVAGMDGRSARSAYQRYELGLPVPQAAPSMMSGGGTK